MRGDGCGLQDAVTPAQRGLKKWKARVNKARVESFSDGVFAFAITLLVLGFQVPSLDSVSDPLLSKALFAQLPQLILRRIGRRRDACADLAIHLHGDDDLVGGG